jgi:predicted transcriptional regulator of viral defense system
MADISMNNREKLIQRVRENGGFISSEQLQSRSDRYTTEQLTKEGIFSRIRRGWIILQDDPALNETHLLAAIFPQGVFCQFSAWDYHQLTTSLAIRHHLAFPRDLKLAFPDYPPVQPHFAIEKVYRLGISEIVENTHILKIYNLERSVCDAIKFRNKIGQDVSNEILKNYIRRQDRDLDTLLKYAKVLRIENLMTNFICILL